MSDRIALMDAGLIVQLDRPRNIYRRPKTQFVADFIGNSSFLPLETRGGAVSCSGRLVELEGRHTVPTGKGLLVLRPECITVAECHLDGPNSLDGSVRTITFEGGAL
jgi:putative spermidine/putrescine transport system ATP-binding protein